MQQLTQDNENFELGIESILANEGIVRPQFLTKEGKAELANHGVPFCIARVERFDSEFDSEHGQFVYSVLVPNSDGKLLPTLFSLGWNEAREEEVQALQRYLTTHTHIHSCKLERKGKAKKGKQPFYQIVEARDEQGCKYCDGRSIQHPTFPQRKVEVIEADSTPVRPTLSESLEL